MQPTPRSSADWGSVVDAFADDSPERPTAKASLLDAVVALRAAVSEAGFPLALPGREAALARRAALLDQLDDHLLPRLRELSAPALVVVAGSTGAGKSTLVNSLLGEEVSLAGVLRPTTRQPVLVHHPADGELLASHPLREGMEVVAREGVPRGLALVDAPDLDSLVAENREQAERLLEAADLWLFVTTAARYGDALPWRVLDRAAERKVAMAMVLNRVPRDAVLTVRADLLRRLGERGLSSVPLFLVPDAGPHEGLLDSSAVAPVRRWLAVLAGADRAQSIIARTQRGALAALRPWVAELVEAAQAQVDARSALEARVGSALAAPAAAAAAAVRRGAVAEGPVRAAWTAHAGRTGGLGGAWGSRRGQAARETAVTALGAELSGSARVALVAARRTGERIAAATVGDELDGLALPAAVGAAPDEDEAAWVATSSALVRGAAATSATARGAGRLVRLAGERGAGVLLGAAAVGVGAARVLVEQTLGSDVGHRLADEAAEDLATRVAGQVLAAGARVHAALDVPDLAEDAAVRLDLRQAVLREWT